MGAKSSTPVCTSSFSNLKSSQIDRVNQELRGTSGNHLFDEAFKKVYSSLAPVSEVLSSHLQSNGSIDASKVLYVANSIFGNASEQAEILASIHGDVKSIVQSLVEVIAVRCRMETEDSRLLLRYLLREAPSNGSNFSQWLVSSPVGAQLIRFVYAPLIFEKTQLFPHLEGRTVILSLSDIIVINLHLPSSRRNEWTLLFSSFSHGSSFSQIIKRTNEAGPCLVIVESTNGKVFGCFASEGFRIGPIYQGDETCFLFEIKPDIHIYSATGFTKNYAYLNYQQSSLPNGLGMGGFDYSWPFFLHEEYGKGTTLRHISSFEKCYLAGEDTFEIRNIEIWRVGNKPQLTDADEISDDKSVIDKDPGAWAILEMTGRSMKSEAFRDPQPLLDD